jgi:DNA polymerase III delta subunit
LNAAIRPETVNQLVELTGNDLRRLTNEINKLAAAALPEGTVTSELITFACTSYA